MKQIARIIAACLLPLSLFAQADSALVGVWKGKIITTDKQLPYEIVISETGGKLAGFSYTTYTVNSVEMVAVRAMKVSRENGRIITEDEDLLFDNFDKSSPRHIRQTNTLFFDTQGNSKSLTGAFTTKKTKEFRPMSGEISLQKLSDLKESRAVTKLEEMKLGSRLSFIAPIEEDRIMQTKIINPASLPPTYKRTQLVGVTRNNTRRIAVAAITPPAEPIAKAEIKKTVKEVPAAKPVAVPVKTQPPVAKAVSQIPPAPVRPDEVAKATPRQATVSTAPLATAALAKREIETIQTVYFKSDSLMLTLYDNGTVDGDTVSIILDGKMILPKQGLSTNAIDKTIYLPPGSGDSLQMVMYAENLGSIPPNTGLLIIKDGKDRYEIRFSGDLEKNAAIILRRKQRE